MRDDTGVFFLIEATGCAILYVAAVCWLTWPLARAASTSLPFTSIGCLTDPLLLAWGLAHQSRSLAGHLGDYLHGGMFHPTPHAVLYGEAAFGAVPLFAPVFLLTGNPTLALNVVLLGGIAMTATALHLVVRRWTGFHTAGVVAAATFLASPWVMWRWGPVAANYAMLFWLPPILFHLAQPAAGARHAMRLAALAVLQGLCSAYLAAATLIPLGTIGVVRLFRARTRASGITAVGAALGAGGVLAVVFSAHLLVRHANPDLAHQTPFPHVSKAVLRLPSGLFTADSPAFIPLSGWVVIALGAAIGLATRSRPTAVSTAPWGTLTLWSSASLLASLTPLVAWGKTLTTLPHVALLRALGFYEMLREPRRLGVAALIGLAALAGLAFGTAARHVPSRWAGRTASALRVLAAALFIGATLAVDLPYAPGNYQLQAAVADEPWLDAALAQHPGPLLEMPVGPLPRRHARAMYRAIYHHQPVLNGYDGYWPADFPSRMAVACRIPDAEAIRELRRTTGLATILVLLDRAGSQDFPGRVPYDCARWDAARWQEIAAKGGEGPLRLVARRGLEVLFAVGDD
jgi:hypothetical protein